MPDDDKVPRCSRFCRDFRIDAATIRQRVFWQAGLQQVVEKEGGQALHAPPFIRLALSDMEQESIAFIIATEQP